MKENRVKRILREGGLAFGTHVGGIADPQTVELLVSPVSTRPFSTGSLPASPCTMCSSQ